MCCAKWISGRNQILAVLHLLQRLDLETDRDPKAELPTFTVRVAPHVSGVWK